MCAARPRVRSRGPSRALAGCSAGVRTAFAHVACLAFLSLLVPCSEARLIVSSWTGGSTPPVTQGCGGRAWADYETRCASTPGLRADERGAPNDDAVDADDVCPAATCGDDEPWRQGRSGARGPQGEGALPLYAADRALPRTGSVARGGATTVKVADPADPPPRQYRPTFARLSNYKYRDAPVSGASQTRRLLVPWRVNPRPRSALAGSATFVGCGWKGAAKNPSSRKVEAERTVRTPGENFGEKRAPLALLGDEAGYYCRDHGKEHCCAGAPPCARCTSGPHQAVTLATTSSGYCVAYRGFVAQPIRKVRTGNGYSNNVTVEFLVGEGRRGGGTFEELESST